jgi:hypothetical protein
MRLSTACLVLLSALPACAQGAESHWYLDVHRFTPTLTGHYNDTSGGNPVAVDFQNDLALAKDQAKVGYGLEYQGPRFGLAFSSDEEDYAGRHTIAEKIVINNQTFNANTLVTSSLKATNYNLNWTIRAFRWPQFWLGLDLGARATQLKLDATGVEPFTGVTASAAYKTTLPIPQVGPSLGFTGFHNRLVARASYHLLAYKGCTYSHTSADLRIFPLSWLGIMVFADDEHARVPQGSIKSTLDATLDRSGTGLGIVARF